MMSNIYVNTETGSKIKVYEVTDVHVWDEDDSSFDFRDTAKDRKSTRLNSSHT